MNLAVRVKDQDHGHIPKFGEQPTAQSTAGQSPSSNGKININSADAKLLQTLPGIGEVRAVFSSSTASRTARSNESRTFLRCGG